MHSIPMIIATTTTTTTTTVVTSRIATASEVIMRSNIVTNWRMLVSFASLIESTTESSIWCLLD
jgi:hypothetical protein